MPECLLKSKTDRKKHPSLLPPGQGEVPFAQELDLRWSEQLRIILHSVYPTQEMLLFCLLSHGEEPSTIQSS